MRDFVAIDLETATNQRDSICQIGITEVLDGVVQPSKTWLVRPIGNFYFADNIAIHGITPEMTENEPEFPSVWKEVEPYLLGKTVVAHNVSFDMYCLRDSFDSYEIDYPDFEFVCSCRIAQKLYPEFEHHKLDNLTEAFGIKLEHHHDAGADSEACARILLRCLDDSGCSVADIAAHCNLRRGYFRDGAFGSCVKDGRAMTAEDVKKAVAANETPDPESVFYQRTVCFTGSFTMAERAVLQSKIIAIGGTPTNSVTKKTDYLVVGQQNYKVVGESGMSSKQKRAIELRNDGAKIQILSEEQFYELL